MSAEMQWIVSDDGNDYGHYGPFKCWGWHWRVNYEGQHRSLFMRREYTYGRWHWALTQKAAERRAQRFLARLTRLTNIQRIPAQSEGEQG